ncbi:GNAT family N-acetyltransferase [Kitasatospora sp. NPDC058965]|uniref:GNAT family N-acetyltransferase n=1 Tax=Kitasatospora sp. NPDC058965 TaxID=3346682 RepID=UPI0036BD6483
MTPAVTPAALPAAPPAVRRRSRADLPGCERALLAVHRADGYPAVWPAEPAGWLAESGQLAAWVAVAGDGGVVGHVALSRESSAGEEWAARTGAAVADTVAVSRFFVDPAARGQRLGERLLAVAVRQVEHWGSVPVLDVEAGGAAALRVYRATGWQELAVVEQHWTNGTTATVHCFALNRPAGDGR